MYHRAGQMEARYRAVPRLSPALLLRRQTDAHAPQGAVV